MIMSTAHSSSKTQFRRCPRQSLLRFVTLMGVVITWAWKSRSARLSASPSYGNAVSCYWLGAFEEIKREDLSTAKGGLQNHDERASGRTGDVVTLLPLAIKRSCRIELEGYVYKVKLHVQGLRYLLSYQNTEY